MAEIGHVKIAITTNSLIQVDVDFAKARQVVFYDVSYDSSSFLDCAQFAAPKRGEGGKRGSGCSGGGGPEGNDAQSGDPIARKLEALAECDVVFTTGLSDLAAVHMKRMNIFPVKMEKPRDIDEVIEKLQSMMNNNPPLWLRKALGYGRRNAAFLVGPDESDLAAAAN